MKILLSNAAYIGDLVLATSVLPVIKRAFPECKIGFLVGSSAEEVIRDHLLVDWIHVYDHPRLNRSLIPKRIKKERAKATSKQALCEIKERSYDIAFELYSYSKNHAGNLLFQAGIPKRVGYQRTAAPFFFTHHVYWEYLSFHMIENHRKMLYEWGMDKPHLMTLEPWLHYRTSLPKETWEEELPQEYIAVHMGTGEPKREWSLTSWKELLFRMERLGLPLVFLGKGKKEKRRVEEVRLNLKKSVDLVGLSFRQTMAVIQKAKLVVGVESMCGHLAALYQVPGVFIYSGAAEIKTWRPYSHTCEIIIPKGYDPHRELATPDLIHTIIPEEVFSKVAMQLQANKKGVPPQNALRANIFDAFI